LRIFARRFKVWANDSIVLLLPLKATKISFWFCNVDTGVNIEKLERSDKRNNNRKTKRKMKKAEVRIDRMRHRPKTKIYFLQIKKELDGIRLIECNALSAFTL
jgi:hypothetical protein